MEDTSTVFCKLCNTSLFSETHAETQKLQLLPLAADDGRFSLTSCCVLSLAKLPRLRGPPKERRQGDSQVPSDEPGSTLYYLTGCGIQYP